MRDIVVVCPQDRDLSMIEAAGLGASSRVHFAGSDPDFTPCEPRGVVREALTLPADGACGTKDRSALLAAVIAAERDLPRPSIAAMLACMHKPTSRRLQREIVPEATPRFAVLDGDEPPLEPPFFVKPIVGRLSERARLVQSLADVPDRDENAEYANGFAEIAALAGVDRDFGGFIAEELLAGAEVTLEGYVHGGATTVIGVTDSVKYPGTNSFQRFEYPSRLPRGRLDELGAVAERLLPGLGFDGGFFNIEFFVGDAGPAKVIEVNGRIASQFAPLVQALHGRSTYDALFVLACGEDPAWDAGEPDGVALSYVVRRFEDGYVEEVPEPERGLEVLVRPGLRLSEQSGANDPASFRLAILYESGETREEAVERARRRAEALSFRLAPVPPR